jgi:hypothetical protein
MDATIHNTLADAIDRLNAIEQGHAPDAETALADAITLYKALGAYSKEIDAERDRAKRITGEIMTETGQTKASCPAGTAYFTGDSLTVSYDAKALDALCKSNETLARVLTPHRKETTRAGSLTIK